MMGQTTKIDWCEASWNPVTGCDHGCAYCYARGMARRFKGFLPDHKPGTWREENGLYVLDEIQFREQKNGQIVPTPYPFGFAPTFHRYRLNIPQTWKNPKTIFVGSMADLFGKWVPDEWIQEVFAACAKAPQHRYLFLTKNPNRYNELAAKGMLPQEHWYGYTATSQKMLWTFYHADECLVKNLFVSIEPILAPMQPGFYSHVPADWVIVGAETGQRQADLYEGEHQGTHGRRLQAGISVGGGRRCRRLTGRDTRKSTRSTSTGRCASARGRTSERRNGVLSIWSRCCTDKATRSFFGQIVLAKVWKLRLDGAGSAGSSSMP